jgi:uncharacterized protein (DUF58 family)
MLQTQQIQQFSHLELLAKQVVEGFITGLHKSPFHGYSVEFAEHRLYNTGESTRHIDWKLFARTEKLFVKRYEEETNLRCQLIIDNSTSMQYPELNEKNKENKLTFAVKAAASLIYLLKSQRDAFGLNIFSDSITFQSPSKSNPIHQKLIFAQLEKLMVPSVPTDQRKSSIANSLHTIAESINRRSLVVIFSDLMESKNNFEEIFSALQHLKHNKHEVIVFNTFDRTTEEEFNFANRPYLFTDLESGEEIKLQPNQVMELYRDKMKTFKNEVKLKTGQLKIDLIDTDISAGFDSILMQYLIKRSKMI